jgi:hypothetical protein
MCISERPVLVSGPDLLIYHILVICCTFPSGDDYCNTRMRTRRRNNVETEGSTVASGPTIVIESSTDDNSSDMYKDNTTDDSSDWSDQDIGKMKAKAKNGRAKAKKGKAKAEEERVTAEDSELARFEHVPSDCCAHLAVF